MTQKAGQVKKWLVMLLSDQFELVQVVLVDLNNGLKNFEIQLVNSPEYRACKRLLFICFS